jgi:hypothetical protein
MVVLGASKFYNCKKSLRDYTAALKLLISDIFREIKLNKKLLTAGQIEKEVLSSFLRVIFKDRFI